MDERHVPDYLPHEVRFPTACAGENGVLHLEIDGLNADLVAARQQRPWVPQPHPYRNPDTVKYGLET